MIFYDTCIKAFIKGNLGDDLFIFTLCNRYPNTSFVLCGEKEYEHIFLKIPNLKYISTDSFFRKWIFRFIKLPAKILNSILKLFNKDEKFYCYSCFDFVSRHSRHNILISGSIFMELEDKSFSVTPYYENERKYYLLKPYVIGCNFGPYHSEKYKLFFEECFKNVSYICFRDSYSHSLFKNIKAGMAPDILFNVDRSKAVAPKMKDYILISVLNPCKDENNKKSMVLESYINKMTRLSNELIKNGKKLVFLGFCKFQSDDEIANKIIEKLDDKSKVKSVNYPEASVYKALGYIAGSDFVIATRYHAMVLGWLFKKPVLPVIYSKKMINVIEDIAPDTQYIMADKANEWDTDEIVQRIINNEYKISDMTKVIDAAKEHFLMLDKVLK